MTENYEMDKKKMSDILNKMPTIKENAKKIEDKNGVEWLVVETTITHWLHPNYLNAIDTYKAGERQSQSSLKQ